jgi:hypothetical protein
LGGTADGRNDVRGEQEQREREEQEPVSGQHRDHSQRDQDRPRPRDPQVPGLDRRPRLLTGGPGGEIGDQLDKVADRLGPLASVNPLLQLITVEKPFGVLAAEDLGDLLAIGVAGT